jgi:hypothetical protein
MGNDDEDKLLNAIWNERQNIGALSFAPWSLDTDYQFAPREAVLGDDKIKEAKWNALIEATVDVPWKEYRGMPVTSPECGGAKCDL